MMLRIVSQPKLAISALLVCALVLTLAIGFITIRIEQAYLQNHSYFFDAVSYSFHNARLYTQLPDVGRLSLAVQEWIGNGRHPLRTVPLILFAPNLLANQMGHMATALPMLFIFLWVFGWSIYRRTQHLLYAVGCTILFCAIPGLFSPIGGLGAYWLDLPAAFLVGGAALCLLNSSSARDAKWLIGFAVLASLAALSRYVAAAYVFITCAPVLTYYIIRRWRQDRSVVGSVLQPLGIIGIVIFVIAGYFLIAHFESNARFYSIYGYSVFKDVLSSTISVMLSVVDFISVPGTILLGGIGLINLNHFCRETDRDWESLVISTWYGCAVILFLVLVVRVVGASHATQYAVPFILLVCVSPVPLKEGKLKSQRWLTQLTGIIIFMALLIGGRAALSTYLSAKQSSQKNQEQKNFDIALAQELSKEDGLLVWNAYFSEYSWIPTMEAFYRLGKFPLPAGQDYFFSVHESVFKGNYPGLTPEEVNPLIYDNANRWVDIAVVFRDPATANNSFNNEYSRIVAGYVSKKIQNDANWKFIFEVKSNKYGILAGYRNLAAQISNYELLVNGKANLAKP